MYFRQHIWSPNCNATSLTILIEIVPVMVLPSFLISGSSGSTVLLTHPEEDVGEVLLFSDGELVPCEKSTLADLLDVYLAFLLHFPAVAHHIAVLFGSIIIS